MTGTAPPRAARPGSGPRPGGRGAALIGAGILLSRLLGLVRQRLFAAYLGVSDAADVFTAAFRIPNFLQNLFGEGVLSASFVPVYANLHERGDDAGRRELAAAVLSLLLLATAVVVLLGILAAPALTALFVPGYRGEKFDLAVRLVRILFPGAALLVLAAWSLGVLNAHRRFFLAYASGALWNVAMIATLLAFGPSRGQADLVVLLAWGSVAGSLLQFGAQLPAVSRLLGGARLVLRSHSAEVATVLRNFVPVFVGRGVAQISGVIETVIASLLGSGAQATLGYAQMLYMLPVSLFGMSVSAAELTEMSRITESDATAAERLRERTESALRRIAFFVVPSAVAFLAVGDQIVGLIYGTGRFGAEEVRWVWGVLAGAAVGLVASTAARLYASTFYALRDAQTPFRFALVRVAVSTTLGALLALGAPRVLPIDPRWSVAGITIATGLAGWVEFGLLRRALARRIGPVGLAPRTRWTLWAAAGSAAAAAWMVRLVNEPTPPVLRAVLVLAVFGMVYWVFTWKAGVPEAVELRRTIFRKGR